MLRYVTLPLLAILLNGHAHALPQDLGVLREQASQWLRQGSERTYPELQASIEMGSVDNRLHLESCPAPIFSLPSGGHFWGSGSVEVRCVTPHAWRLYINYRIRLTGTALATRHPLAARAQVRPGDVESRQVNYIQPPESYLRTLPGEVYTSRPLAAGQPLTLDGLVLPPLVQAGRAVRVMVQGRGFGLTQQGIALASAGAGQQVKVRTNAGRIIQATVRDTDTVEISP